MRDLQRLSFTTETCAAKNLRRSTVYTCNSQLQHLATTNLQVCAGKMLPAASPYLHTSVWAGLCQRRALSGARCCTRDEGEPSEQASNNRKLLPSNGGGGERYGKGVSESCHVWVRETTNGPPPSLHGIYSASSLLRAVRPCPAARYFRPHGAAACAFSLSTAEQVLKFRTRAQAKSHATCTPDTAWPVNRSIRRSVSMPHPWFTCIQARRRRLLLDTTSIPRRRFPRSAMDP